MLDTTSYQRRKHPRHNISLEAELITNMSQDSLRVPCLITDLSRYGARLEASAGVQPSEMTTIRLTLPTLGEASSHFVVSRREPCKPSDRVEYAGELSFLGERGRRKIHTFLRSLEGTADRVGRRKGVRRQASATLAPSTDRRVRDRRRNFGIFNDCVSFAARVPGWRAMYTLFQPNESERPARVWVSGRELISFGSKDYLGLAHDPRVKEAAIKAIERFGVSVSGSRAMNGTHTLHEQLESELASFKKMEASVVFSLGYLTNIGLLTALLRKGDVAFLDERAHGSIFDGCRYSGAKVVSFRHNSGDDLRAKIRHAKAPRSLIVVDGVYSVDGDLANLPEISAVASETGIPLMVDDAHGVGILGETGAGTTEYFGMLGGADLDMGTFSAAFGGVGGFVACKKVVADYLRHFSTGFTFTVGLPAPNIASVLEALRIIRNGTELRERLWANAKHLKCGLESLGYPISPTQSAVLAIRTGDERTTYQLDRALRDRGVYVNSFCRPTVRRGESILRLSVSAVHSESDIEKSLGAFKAVKSILDNKVYVS